MRWPNRVFSLYYEPASIPEDGRLLHRSTTSIGRTGPSCKIATSGLQIPARKSAARSANSEICTVRCPMGCALSCHTPDVERHVAAQLTKRGLALKTAVQPNWYFQGLKATTAIAGATTTAWHKVGPLPAVPWMAERELRCLLALSHPDKRHRLHLPG